jgi:hypothetical protein
LASTLGAFDHAYIATLLQFAQQARQGFDSARADRLHFAKAKGTLQFQNTADARPTELGHSFLARLDDGIGHRLLGA